MPVGDENDELALTAVTAKISADDDLPGHLQLFVIGSGTFDTHPLQDSGRLTIGRSSACDIPINDESISRHHAILELGETVTIEDLGSVNGTTVRGAKLEPGKPVAISVGELVGLGKASIILQQRTRPVRLRKLWTHDYFEARLEEECARESRSGAPFALLRIQPERRAPASFLEETLGDLLRESDILGTYGPNVYEVLLIDAPAENVDEAVRRLENKLLERGLRCRISAACCPRDGRTPYQLVAKVQESGGKDRSRSKPEIVVADAQMQSLYRLLEQIAASDICVLLLGETGVGKEIFARALHHASPRSAGPLIEVNCAALAETLLESELFGHEKGAFTNAIAAKPGLLEMAHGGTLFLDEIGDMPLSTQVKLLRVIEDRQLRRVGALKARPIDVRFVAATNADIEGQVGRGTFRRDLFFRLNGATIVIPPLRERMSELEPLARAFVSRARTRGSGQRPTLTPQALDVLRSYTWPGNVRELKNVIERAIALSGGGPIGPEHVAMEKMRAMKPASQGDAPRPGIFRWLGGRTPPPELLRPPQPRKGSEEEQQWILRALERAGGNQTLAARLLGISRRTLVSRLNELPQVDRPRKRRPD